MDEITINLIALIIGWGLDIFLGDPSSLPHPIVYMGKWIGMCEKKLNKNGHRVAKGAVFALVSIFGTWLLVWELCSLPKTVFGYTWVAIIGETALKSILVFFCLAGHTLRKEVTMVFEAVDRSLDEGRKQVARIVGRDTGALTAQEVRTAALETLAENLSDGVIAPLFWFCVFGVPGMMVYKMINTMDSMIGYKNPRYKDFGCWAAHIDDIANYLPARITAFLLIGVYGMRRKVQQSLSDLIRFVCTYGPKHASPNSGWPEAALAGILNCRFGGPHHYFGEIVEKPYIGENERKLQTNDMKLSTKLSFQTELVSIIIATILLIFLIHIKHG